MSWKDEYLPASFRDVSFFVHNSRVSGGRRLVAHQYPRRDETEHEDLGAKDKSYTFDAYIIGDSYFAARDKLESAFEEGSVGRLVHPYRGAVSVVVDTYTLNESFDKGGAVFFSVTFKHEPKPALAAVTNKKKHVLKVRADLDAAIEDWFVDAYDLSLATPSILDDILDTLDSALSVLDSVKQAAATAAAFKRSIANIRGRLIALRVNAQAIAFTMKGLVDYGVELIDAVSDLFTPKDQLREQRNVYSSTTYPYVDTSPDIASDSNYPSKQIQNVLAYNSVASSMTLLTQASFGSVEEAEEEQGLLFETIDEISNADGVDDRIFEAMRAARSAVHDFIQDESINLPTLVERQQDRETSALALAYDVYGDVAEMEQIVALNNLIHPGFISKAKVLKLRVISE